MGAYSHLLQTSVLTAVALTLLYPPAYTILYNKVKNIHIYYLFTQGLAAIIIASIVARIYESTIDNTWLKPAVFITIVLCLIMIARPLLLIPRSLRKHGRAHAPKKFDHIFHLVCVEGSLITASLYYITVALTTPP